MAYGGNGAMVAGEKLAMATAREPAPPHDEGAAARGTPADRLWRLGYRVAHRLLTLWWRVRRPAARGAAVAAWWDGRLLAVRSSYRGDLLDLPGGGVGRGEGLAEAAARELREEVGIGVEPGALGAPALRLEFAQEGRRIVETLFEWRPSRPPPAPRVDRREIVWAGWLAPGELAGRPLAPGLAGYLAALREGEGKGARGGPEGGRRGGGTTPAGPRAAAGPGAS